MVKKRKIDACARMCVYVTRRGDKCRVTARNYLASSDAIGFM